MITEQTYEQIRDQVKKLEQTWTPEINYVEERRRTRDIDVSVEQLQAKGTLKSDETLVPIRVIDSNIRREQPSYVAFLTQSWRLAIFKPVLEERDTKLLERAFTDGLRYPGWEIPFYKTIDGFQVHGRDAIEIQYDTDKPLHVGFDHIGAENLFFPTFIKNLEFAERIARRHKLSGMQLKSFIKKGFNAAQVQYLLEKREGQMSRGEEQEYIVYHVWQKIDGTVYEYWISLEDCCTDYLTPPSPLWMGREQMQQTIAIDPLTGLEVPSQQMAKVYETQYPVKLCPYKTSEKEEILSNYGRCFEDTPKQEAQIALWTSFINGTVRASNIYGSPKQPDSASAAVKQTDVQLVHGALYNTPIEFWHTDYPPVSVLDGAMRLDSQTQQETGQVAYSVLTRKDTEKTATELQMAQNQSQLLSTVQVTLFATWLREVFGFTWLIVQSLAMKGEVTLKGCDMDTISALYDIDSSGSTDVVAREQKLQRRMQFWPVVQQTPLAGQFLADIIRETFPEDADKYIGTLNAGDVKAQFIQQLMGVIQSLVMQPDGVTPKPEIDPQQQQMLTTLAQQAAQIQQIKI